jgi:hypothetical protein
LLFCCCPLVVYSSSRHVFGFDDNLWFQFFYCMSLKKLSTLVPSNIKELWVLFFFKNLKEVIIFMKELVRNGWFPRWSFFSPINNCIKTLLLWQPVLSGYLILCIIVGFDFKNYFKLKDLLSFIQVISVQLKHFHL